MIEMQIVGRATLHTTTIVTPPHLHLDVGRDNPRVWKI